MAFFNSSRGSTNISSAITVIAYGTKIKGDIRLKCHLHIDGEIEGEVQTDGNVVIGKSGVAKGDFRASNIIISGRFEGSIDADAVQVLEEGKLFGKVISKEFAIEPNALFEGESRLKVEHVRASDDSRPITGVAVTVADARLEKKDNKLTAV
jgi:cytoskeletal protein CcmA (bactofilin family)